MRFSGLFRLAFVELNHNRFRLLIYSFSISIGIAALFATGSLKKDLISQIDKETRALVGGDLVIKGYAPISDSLFQSVIKESENDASEKSFASMVVFKNKGQNRLVNVRAISSNYPLVGDITDKEGDSKQINKEQGFVSINQSLAIQYGLKLGDSLQIGNSSFQISAFHSKAPGQSGIAATVAPTVFISLTDLDSTGLVRIGSRIQRSYYFKMKDEKTANIAFNNFEKLVIDEGLRIENIETGRERLGRTYKNLFRFLNLAAFIALIIGGIGVGSAIDLFLSEKKKTVAVLKCIGFKYQQIATVFLLQIIALGLFGSLFGIAIGLGVQQVLPTLFKDIFVVDISDGFHASMFWTSILSGVAISVLFGLRTLIPLLMATPMMALRSNLESQKYFSKINIIIRMIQLFVLIVITWFLAGDLVISLVFTGMLLVLMLSLWGLAVLLRKLARKASKSVKSFEWKYAVNSLYRPQNQTVLLISVIGLSVILVLHLFFIRSSLISTFQSTEKESRPNLIIFDIDNGAVESISNFLKSKEAIVFDPLSIVPMRIHQFKGRSIYEWKKDSSHSIPAHVFNREYRVTERVSMGDNEVLVSGEWTNNYTEGIIPISIEENFARQANLELGDAIEFNVFGSILNTQVSSIRKVDFTQMKAAFTIVFPKGSLGGAPVMYAVSARVAEKEKMMNIQNELMSKFKNISVIDLELVFESVMEVGAKIEMAIQFMFSFSAFTALIVLINTLYVTRFQRMRESAVLRTLGVVSGKLMRINIYEFLILGLLSVLAGVLFSLIVTWMLMVFLFKVPFSPDLFTAGIILLGVVLLVAIMGAINSRSLVNVSPMHILRGNN